MLRKHKFHYSNDYYILVLFCNCRLLYPILGTELLKIGCIPYQHDLRKSACLQILKTCDLFSRADTCMDDWSHFCCIICTCLFVSLSSKHEFTFLIQIKYLHEYESVYVLNISNLIVSIHSKPITLSVLQK